MSISNFIPVIWSEQLHTSLNEKYIAVAHCNRDFEYELKEKGGNKIKICGVGSIDVHDFEPSNAIANPQNIDDTCVELDIDQMKYFNFMINDVDLAQTSPRLVEHTTKIAAEGLSRSADRYVFDVCKTAPIKIECPSSDVESLMNSILLARQKLYENNVSEGTEVVFEISPAVATEILKLKICLPYDHSNVIETGYLGSFAGCKIYVSNNISAENGYTYNCIMRTTRAVAFAEQISEIVAYRPENRFADAIKGLYTYGAKVIYPTEIVNVKITTPEV